MQLLSREADIAIDAKRNVVDAKRNVVDAKRNVVDAKRNVERMNL